MPLTPQAQSFLNVVNQLPKTAFHRLPDMQAAAEIRRMHEERPAYLAPEWVSMHSVQNLSTDHQNPIPLRVYTPINTDSALPVLVFYHGGGMVIGTLDSYDTLCRQIAKQSGCIVVSVDYRLAPEHKFPAAVEDAFNALLWVSEHAKELQADPQKIAIGGDSAGGNLAAVVAILAKKQLTTPLKCQILIYPATAPHADSKSHMECANNYFLERETVLWFHKTYIRSDKDREDFRYAPLIAEDLTGLPPALVIVAQYDTLRDEGVAYAKRLQQSYVKTTLSEYKGMFHPFVSLAGILDEGKAAITEVANTIREYMSME